MSPTTMRYRESTKNTNRERWACSVYSDRQKVNEGSVNLITGIYEAANGRAGDGRIYRRIGWRIEFQSGGLG
jgi:hypothetical protein